MKSQNIENSLFQTIFTALILLTLASFITPKETVEVSTSAQVTEMHSIAQTETPMHVVVIVGKRLPKEAI